MKKLITWSVAIALGALALGALTFSCQDADMAEIETSIENPEVDPDVHEDIIDPYAP